MLINQCVTFNMMVGMAPQDGFEPPAKRLTVACSTAELPGTRALGSNLIHHKDEDARLVLISKNQLHISLGFYPQRLNQGVKEIISLAVFPRLTGLQSS